MRKLRALGLGPRGHRFESCISDSIMKIGFDFYKTISAYPKVFRELASSLTSEGNEIVVISAVGKSSDKDNYTRHVREFLETHGITYKSLHIVQFDKDEEIPQLKLEACKTHGVEVYFDDRLDVCTKLHENGVISMRVGVGGNSKDKSFFAK